MITSPFFCFRPHYSEIFTGASQVPHKMGRISPDQAGWLRIFEKSVGRTSQCFASRSGVSLGQNVSTTCGSGSVNDPFPAWLGWSSHPLFQVVLTASE
jgi:hypothetical protein